MKSSPIIVIFTLLACLCVAQPLPETVLDGNFPSGNELLTSNYDDNFEDLYEISEMNTLLDENGFHFNQQDTQINSEFSEIPSECIVENSLWFPQKIGCNIKKRRK